MDLYSATASQPSFTSTYKPNLIQIKVTFCGWTNGCMDEHRNQLHQVDYFKKLTNESEKYAVRHLFYNTSIHTNSSLDFTDNKFHFHFSVAVSQGHHNSPEILTNSSDLHQITDFSHH